jgi:hypothetical protein
MQPLDELRQYLQDRANLIRKLHSKPDCQYAGFEELVLDRGTVMEAKPLPKNIKRGLPKSCYWNSQQLAFKRKLPPGGGYNYPRTQTNKI